MVSLGDRYASSPNVVTNLERFFNTVNSVLVSILLIVSRSTVNTVSRCPTLFFWKNTISLLSNCPKQ